MAQGRVEAVACRLTTIVFRRDVELRMRSLPGLAMVLAPLAVGGYLGTLRDPLALPGSASILSLTAIYLLGFPIVATLRNLRYSRAHAAAWVLETAPIADRCDLARGMKNAVVRAVLVPLSICLALALAWLWKDPVHAVWQVGAGVLAALIVAEAAQSLFLRLTPFSVPPARGEDLGIGALQASLLGGLPLSLVPLHWLAARSELHLVQYTGALLVLLALSRGRRGFRAGFARLGRSDGGKAERG
jgi:hypothetical protein